MSVHFSVKSSSTWWHKSTQMSSQRQVCRKRSKKLWQKSTIVGQISLGRVEPQTRRGRVHSDTKVQLDKGKGKQKPSNEPSQDGNEIISIRVVNRCRNSLSKNILIAKVQSIVILKSEQFLYIYFYTRDVIENQLNCQLFCKMLQPIRKSDLTCLQSYKHTMGQRYNAGKTSVQTDSSFQSASPSSLTDILFIN